MKGALARHHALVQGAIEAYGGYVFQIVGDAFCAAFHTVLAGVAAAAAAQRALIAEPWGEPGPIRVRMAVHTGTADFQAGAYKSGEYGSGLTLSHAPACCRRPTADRFSCPAPRGRCFMTWRSKESNCGTWVGIGCGTSPARSTCSK